LKSPALTWRNPISSIIGDQMGFKSSLADLDETHGNGYAYYAYILVYVDDVLSLTKA
jgi:hypothetical protein